MYKHGVGGYSNLIRVVIWVDKFDKQERSKRNEILCKGLVIIIDRGIQLE